MNESNETLDRRRETIATSRQVKYEGVLRDGRNNGPGGGKTAAGVAALEEIMHPR